MLHFFAHNLLDLEHRYRQKYSEALTYGLENYNETVDLLRQHARIACAIHFARAAFVLGIRGAQAWIVVPVPR
jgi:hypothetical protein